MDDQTKKIDELLEFNNKLLNEHEKQTRKLSNIKDSNVILHRKVDDIQDTLDVVSDRFVPPTEDVNKDEVFILLKSPIFGEDKEFHVIRCMKEIKNIQVKDYFKSKLIMYNKDKDKYDKLHLKDLNIKKYIVLEIETPNSKNIWHRIKESVYLLTLKRN